MYTFEYYYIRPYKIGNTANCYSVDRSWGYLAKWNKSEIKSQALYDFYPYVVYKTESNTCSIFKIIVSHLKYCKSIISGLSDSTLNTYFQDNSLTNIFKYKSITPFLWFKSPHDLFSSEKNPVFNMAFEVLHNIASFHVSLPLLPHLLHCCSSYTEFLAIHWPPRHSAFPPTGLLSPYIFPWLSSFRSLLSKKPTYYLKI